MLLCQVYNLSAALAAGLLAGCGNDSKDAEASRTEGPVVAAPDENAAVDATPTDPGAAPAAAASSYTEAQARSAIESAGYTNVGSLMQNEQGLWQGKGTKGGPEVGVSVDFKGAVSQQ